MTELRRLQERFTNPEPLPAQRIEIQARHHDVPAQAGRVEIRFAEVGSDLGHKLPRNEGHLTSGTWRLGHSVIPLKAEVSHRLHP